MIFYKAAKKGVELSKVAAEYGIERVKQYNDPEFKELGIELGKKWVNIADEKTNKILDKSLNYANEKLDEVKNGEDELSKKQAEVKDYLKDAIDKSDAKIDNENEESEDIDKEISLMRQQLKEREELRAKQKEELKELEKKHKEEQKIALKDKTEDLKVKKDETKDSIKDKTAKAKAEAKDLKNDVKSAKDDLKEDARAVRQDRRDRKAAQKANKESEVVDVDAEVKDE